jgi:hypothetical protein
VPQKDGKPPGHPRYLANQFMHLIQLLWFPSSGPVEQAMANTCTIVNGNIGQVSAQFFSATRLLFAVFRKSRRNLKMSTDRLARQSGR